MSNQPPPIPPQSQKILIVDDDAVIVRSLSMKLAANGYKVLTASEPSDAMQSVRTEKPDLILLDITFPPDVIGVSWDGFGVVEWMRRMNEESAIPVIIITGGDSAKYKERAEAIGAAAFFNKPIQHDDLLKVISRTLAEWASKSKPGSSAAKQA